MIAGCYTLHLYCENVRDYPDPKHEPHEFPHEYTHELGSACRRAARRAGWIINEKAGTAICPRCARERDSEWLDRAVAATNESGPLSRQELADKLAISLKAATKLIDAARRPGGARLLHIAKYRGHAPLYAAGDLPDMSVTYVLKEVGSGSATEIAAWTGLSAAGVRYALEAEKKAGRVRRIGRRALKRNYEVVWALGAGEDRADWMASSHPVPSRHSITPAATCTSGPASPFDAIVIHSQRKRKK